MLQQLAEEKGGDESGLRLKNKSENRLRTDGESGRSGNLKITRSSLELAGSKPGRVKPRTLILILVAS